MPATILCYWCGESVESAGVYTDRHGEQQHVCTHCLDNAEPAED